MVLIHDYFPGMMHRYALKYIEILKANNIYYEIVNCHDDGFYEKLSNADLLIFYLGTDDTHLLQLKSLLNVINQETHIKCYPNYTTSWHLDDKVSQYYLLKVHGFPTVECQIFWDKQLALDFINSTSFPVIFKLKGGAGSLNVLKIENQKQSEKLIKLMFGKGIRTGYVPGVNRSQIFNKDFKRNIKVNVGRILAELGLRNRSYHSLSRDRGYILFQKYLANNAYDTRITIIGNKAFAFRRFNRPNDFRSSGSGLIDYDINQIDLKMIETAFKVSQALGFQTMSYDFLKDENGNHKIMEMCHLFADWAVYGCSGHWDRHLQWHDGHLWPQYAELQNLLGRDDLVQPEFEVYKGRNNLIKIKR